jgi:hypothetical protein
MGSNGTANTQSWEDQIELLRADNGRMAAEIEQLLDSKNNNH